MNFDTFVELHKPQLESADVPKHFWKKLHEKLENKTFDAGTVFTLLKVDYGDYKTKNDVSWVLQLHSEEGIRSDDPNCIYLIDHAWTFRIERAKTHLRTLNDLKHRMASIMGIEITENEDALCEEIFDELWKFSNCYWTQDKEDAEDRIPVWYILDEVGSAVHHSSKSNCRIVPLMYLQDNVVYSLIFPIKNIKCNELITRNFVETSTDNKHIQLLPWIQMSFDNVSYEHEPLDPDYFLNGHVQETLPILSKLQQIAVTKNKYKVFSEYSLLNEYLTNDSFIIVDNEDEADILWYIYHFTNYEEFSGTDKFINQFPFEYILTNKDLLSIICTHNPEGRLPMWLPTTYNLKTELERFVSYFMHRKQQGLDNHWIVKPVNLARSLDTHITKNINYIVRLSETGTKIVQKYIHNPVLFYRSDCSAKVKFDIRYVILLKCVKPLEVYVYKNFFLRFANKPFELSNFDDYEIHFTVMNYTNDGQNLKHMMCNDFVKSWTDQYPSWPWEEVETSIMHMLSKVLKYATTKSPPCGISESPQSRALYAVDIMLERNEEKIQPKLLEINWMPDCERACKYYPNFFNDVFQLLFCNVNNSTLFYDLQNY